MAKSVKEQTEFRAIERLTFNTFGLKFTETEPGANREIIGLENR